MQYAPDYQNLHFLVMHDYPGTAHPLPIYFYCSNILLGFYSQYPYNRTMTRHSQSKTTLVVIFNLNQTRRVPVNFANGTPDSSVNPASESVPNAPTRYGI